MSEPTIEQLRANTRAVLNRLAKWRTILAGWQLGTRAKTDPECQAVRDQRELLLLMRAEMTALAMLLVNKGVFSEKEWLETLAKEAQLLDAANEKRFPGIRAVDDGIQIFDVKLAAETMKGWRP